MPADDVVRCFNDFAATLGTTAGLGRQAAETPREYLERLAHALGVRTTEVATAAETFALALYGRKDPDPAAARAFCAVLQAMLARVSARGAPGG